MDDLISRKDAIRRLKKMATDAYRMGLKGKTEVAINCCIDVIERQCPTVYRMSCDVSGETE